MEVAAVKGQEFSLREGVTRKFYDLRLLTWIKSQEKGILESKWN